MLFGFPFLLTSSNGRITYSNNAQGNTWGFNQKFTLSFDLDIPDEAVKHGYKSYRNAVTNQTEPQVVKSYYRDVNNNGDLSNPDKVGVGGSWGQSVTAQAKDLTSQGYYFVKSSEYINDDNHVASSQNSSMSHQLNSDKIADVFYYSNSASVTAKYVDEHNKTLHPDNIYSGVTGGAYKTQSIDIPNYHLVKVNGQESGNYAMPVNNASVGNNPVVYVYEPDQESATVQYIDDTTGKILESHNLTGSYGTTDSYSTQDTIKKYENDGYVVVSDNYPSNGVTYNSDTHTFQVHLDNLKFQKDTQKGDLQAEHDQVVQTINADPTLTSAEKQKQVQAANQVLQDNGAKINQAQSADVINAAMVEAKKGFNQAHQSGRPVADQQAAQKQSLQAEHDQVVQEINTDPTLTSAEKQKQVEAADQALSDNQAKVDQAKDADAINAAMAAGKQAIDATHQAGTPVANQQAAQLNEQLKNLLPLTAKINHKDNTWIGLLVMIIGLPALLRKVKNKE
ncbi:Chromosome segregation ATPase Smc (Smc) [Fructobacillus tropaeoli]|uniref:mucin-binding protein n=1 Tax=Fructobacillus tropaeoli TaxID=709323 RepID=UPI002DA1CD96|nr:Chromosome segregation ATPase Smc (Smc) [Fructobacillus tropaeoli]